MTAWLLLLVLAVTQSLPLAELPAIDLSGAPPSTRQAIEAAQRDLMSDPLNPELNGRLGKLAHAYEQYELARAAYSRSAALQPAAFEWQYLMGTVEDLLGRSDQALPWLQQAVERAPVSLPALVRLTETLVKLGRLEEARQAAERVVATVPGHPLGHYWLGRALLESGESEAAIGHLERASSLFPQFGSAHYSLALAYRDRGEQTRARQEMELYQSNRNRWPPSGDTVLESVRSLRAGAGEHLARGIELAESNQVESAIREHQEALRLQPDLVQAHVNLIRLQAKVRDFDKAEAHYAQAVALNPNLADLHYNYGVLLIGLERYSEAVLAFEKALQINPHSATAHNNLGFLRERQGKLVEAAQHYQAAVDSDTSYRLARFNLGRIRLAQKRFDEAVEHFSRILSPKDESTPRYQYALASAYVRMGKTELGLQLARQAASMAREMGQSDLASSIEGDLQRLQTGRPH